MRQSNTANDPRSSENRALASPERTESNLRSFRPKLFSSRPKSKEISSLCANT